jgi:hypothetical protein
MLGLAYGRAGRVAEAQKILAELRDLAQRAYVSPSTFVLIHLGLGELYKALDWTEKAIDECDSIMFLLPFNPIFDSLRSHPRYKVLLRKMNLEP